MKRRLYAVLVAVVLAIGFVGKAGPVDGWEADGTFIGPSTVTAFEADDFIMGCGSLWPFC